MVILENIFNYLRRYKILHIAFWVYALISLYHEVQEYHPIVANNAQYIYPCLFILLLFEAACVYFIMYYLVPRFFNKRMYGSFLLLSIASIVSFSFWDSFLE